MAEPSTTPGSSASRDDAASQPCRYAHGSEVIAELRARAMAEIKDANRKEVSLNSSIIGYFRSQQWRYYRGKRVAFIEVSQWLDELSGSDQTQHEGTKPSS